MGENSNERADQMAVNPPEKNRKPYVTPKLTEYGQVEALTRSAGISCTDAVTFHV